MSVKDGGRAFPRPYGNTGHSNEPSWSTDEVGMSLRDWFAGQALAGYLALHGGDNDGVPGPNMAARRAYAYAAAMLAQREAK
mgnify:CR=1 FL=1